MKLLFSLFFCICLFSILVSAEPIDVNLVKSDYAAGETLQAEIIINDIEDSLTTSDISFFNGLNKVSITPFLSKLGDDYYVYFQIPLNVEVGNYSLIIEDVIYNNNGLLIQKDFSKDFAIVSKDSVVSVTPGIIIADDLDSQNNFNVYLTNRVNTTDVSFSVDSNLITLSDESVSLVNEYILEVYVSGFLEGVSVKNLDISYGDEGYTIPIWFGNGEVDVVEENKTEDPLNNLVFLTETDSINLSFLIGESKHISINFKNRGNETINNINFYLQGNIDQIIDLEYSSLDVLSSGEIVNLGLSLNVNKDAIGYYSGSLVMENDFGFDEIFFSFYFSEDVQLNETSSILEDLDIIDLEDYKPEEEKGFEINYWIIVIIIFVLIVVILLIRYLKYQKRIKSSFPFFR